MSTELGYAPSTVFAAFSVALLVSAAVGPFVGAWIDRHGGRWMLVASNVVLALGLAGLALSTSLASLVLAWALMGLGMGCGLYEAAFAGLVRWRGKEARDLITGITLIGGFASTIGWPLTTALLHTWGWRWTCAAWALVHLLVALPLNVCLPSALAPAPAAPEPSVDKGAEPPSSEPLRAGAARRAEILLAVCFAAVWFVSTAMAAHLPGLLMASGASVAAAIGVAALVGPAQVGGRLLEFGVLRRWSPLLSGRLAALMHPLAVGLLLLFGTPVAALFALMHGAGNGVLTIAKGNLPLYLFGAQGYGKRQGVLMVPARLAQASAPWVFGLCLERWGARALLLSAAVGLVAFLAVMVLPNSRGRNSTDMQ